MRVFLFINWFTVCIFLSDLCAGVVCADPPNDCHEAQGTCDAGSCIYPEKAPGSTCSGGICQTSGECVGNLLK